MQHVGHRASDEIAQLRRENEKLQGALDEIGRTALACWTDMQGRLQDDAHKRAHGVLGSIVQTAAASLPQNDA